MKLRDKPRSEMREWYESDRDRVIPRDPPEAPPDWLAHALRFCRDGDESLARLLKVVPARYVLEHKHGLGMGCLCGAQAPLPDREFVECPGSCGRWFVRDGGTVWAARLPTQEP